MKKQKAPSIDILLTYWGDYALLRKTIDSVLDQTNNNWHLYIFDDCYPDKTAYEYYTANPHEKITYYRHGSNIGITKNFNYAIDSASAEYCLLLGCDDLLLPEYVATALKNIGAADMYQPTVDVIDANDKSYLPLGDRVKRWLQPKNAGIYKGEKIVTSLCNGNWLYFPSILWRTSTIKKYKFNEQYKIVEDVQLEFEILSNGGALYFDTATTFQYRRFAESLSSKEKSKDGVRFNEEKAVYTMFSEHFKSKGWNSAALAARARITSRLNNLIN